MILYTALYRLAIGVYFIAIRLAAMVNQKAALFVNGRKGLLRQIKQKMAADERRRIWMHCASLGEFEQGRPVLEALREQYPQYAIVVTFFSPSGYEVRKNYDGADYVFYLPIDTPGNARLFLDIVQPSLCIFVKYEFWYYYLSNIGARKIPALLVSAIFNKDQGFFKWYGSLQRAMLRSFTHVFVQDAASMHLLKDIKLDEVSISGDTRFDRVIKASKRQDDLPIASDFAKDSKIIVAGSTWKDDEIFLHTAIKLLPREWKLILVPHEVHIEHLRQIEGLFGNDLIKWSQYPMRNGQPVNEDHSINQRVLLVDKVGFLLQLYRYSRVAWIGGGFGKDGVHNVLEAAVYGQPCYYGPIFQQFLEAKELIQAGGAFSYSTPQQFARAIEQMESSHAWKQYADAARNYVHSKSGATDVVLAYIARLQLLT